MSDPSTSLAAGPLSTAPRKEATEKPDLEGAGIGKETALGVRADRVLFRLVASLHAQLRRGPKKWSRLEPARWRCIVWA